MTFIFPEQNWIPYENNYAPQIDGISIGFSTGGVEAYIGRAIQKLPEGNGTVIGRVHLTNGIYILNDPSASEELAEKGEFLQKGPNSSYEWVSSHTDQRVENAVQVQVRCDDSTTCDADCDCDGRFAYIGRVSIDGVHYVGTVYKNEGLLIATSCGEKMTLSSFEVLTCVRSGRCQEKERSCGETDCGWQED